MRDKLCFVQFLHPGGEHEPDSATYKKWNIRSHKRKFLRQRGWYVADGIIREGVIAFWTEWEPESNVVQKVVDPISHGPHYFYEPFYADPESYQGLQNTDPFVFGEQFHYTGCQQRTKRGPTQLRYLSRGSVILFGSCEDKQRFVLDTVLVVDHWIDHSRSNYKKALGRRISPGYSEVTISPWYKESFAESKSCAATMAEESWRLYFGASYEKPVDDMYSFFPCVPLEAARKGFARPVISLPQTITNNLLQGKRLNPQQGIEEIKALWNEVVAQVHEQALELGVYAEMPPKKKGVHEQTA